MFAILINAPPLHPHVKLEVVKRTASYIQQACKSQSDDQSFRTPPPFRPNSQFSLQQIHDVLEHQQWLNCRIKIGSIAEFKEKRLWELRSNNCGWQQRWCLFMKDNWQATQEWVAFDKDKCPALQLKDGVYNPYATW